MKTSLLSWLLAVPIAGMLLFTGVFKLMGSAEALDTFAQIGGAPAMYFTGIVEIATASLLLIPKTRIYGALLAVATMTGAIFTHLAGLMPNNDEMLPMAIVLFVLGAALTFLHRHELPMLGSAALKPDAAPNHITS